MRGKLMTVVLLSLLAAGFQIAHGLEPQRSLGSCSNPHNISVGLESSSWVPTTSTCDTTNSSPCWSSRDYTYRLPAFNATRNVTIDTCVAGVDAWDTFLFVIPEQDGVCTSCPFLTINDDGSMCGQYLSRVTFTASAGVDYLVVVEGYDSTRCGVPAIDVISTLVQDPSNIIPEGSCSNPHNISVDLGSSSWVPTASTCNTTDSSPCWSSRDYTYRLPAFNATRNVTIDTCVAGVDAWDTFLFVIPEQDGVCTSCHFLTINDDGSMCGQYLSRVTFTASAGVDYLVVVEGYDSTRCGVPAIDVISTLVQDPSNIIPEGSCSNPHNISVDLGSSSWVPTASTCNTTDSSPCWSSRDYTYRLPAFNATRNVTIDTCVAGVDAWDTFLFVIPEQDGVCTSCHFLTINDDGSMCGQYLSRVTFTASAGVDYLVVVEGYDSTRCGVPAIDVISTLVQDPSNIIPEGSCSNPHNISVDLGSSSWVPTASTCNTTDSSPCWSSRDYTYRLPAFNATRNVTIDTCVAGVDAWDTFLFVIPEQDGVCTSCHFLTINDDGSMCGQYLSRVTFTASAGVDYLVVVEGYDSTRCGVPAIDVISTLVQDPSNIIPEGSCSNPHNISLDLGSSSWVPTASTCNTTDSSPCLSSGDYTYRLPAFSATRNITIDTCVAGVDAWDTVLFVFPEQDGACTSCPSNALFNDQGSECGQGLSRVTFNASAGVDYLVVVEGYFPTSCGVPAINVTSTVVQDPSNIIPIGSCSNPHNISVDLGSSSWVPTASTCNTTDSSPCWSSRDYTYRLPAFNATRNVTIDTCVAGVDAWDTFLFVIPEQDGVCTSCHFLTINDDGSMCGQYLSRVTFTASAGVDYLVVVEGYDSTRCGVPAIDVISTLVQDPSNIIPEGSCSNPHNISLDLGSSSWVPTASTCNTTDSSPCLSSGDYTYRLPAFSATRNITIDTCVAGVDAWDTVLFVFPEQDGACTSCPSNALFNDQGSECGQGLSRVTFNASAGVDYLVVVEGYFPTSCGVPAINVTSTVVQDPSNIIPIGSCINPHNISVDLGSSSWVPTTSTCDTTNSFRCSSSRDYTYRLPAFSATRNITIDTCVAGVDAWDTILYVLPDRGVCTCPSGAWYDDQGSECGQDRSSVNFIASAGVDYLVVVEGYYTSCGVPAINVTSTLVQAPPNITSIGSCSNPHNISLDLGSSSWVPTASTCNTTDSSPCLSSGDYTYRLPALNATRNITIDTCVAGVDAWDTVLFVFPEQDGACTSCPSNALFNDQGSECGQGLSRVTFNASAGVDYLVVVEGYGLSSCGVPAISIL
ncbi:hypothetical protein V8C86DRAFT_1016474 [Haematococcus lacustris]